MGAKQDESCLIEDRDLEEGIVVGAGFDLACKRTRAWPFSE